LQALGNVLLNSPLSKLNIKYKAIMKLRTIMLTFFTTIFFTGLHAQSLNSTGKDYYKGNDHVAAGDTLKAIASYQDCAEKSAELGELGACIKIKAETNICELYLDKGIRAFNKGKFDASLEMLEKAETYAILINDPGISSKIANYKAANFHAKGNEFYQRNKYKKAVEMYDAALEINPEFANAYYGLVLSYVKLDEGLKMEEAEKNVQDYSSDDKLKNKARNTAALFYKNKCKEALDDEQYNIVTMMAQKSINYISNDPEVFYYSAIASNMREDWVTAEKSALRAIRLSGQENPDYYYELGLALEGSDKTEEACEAYSKVSVGPNKTKAEYRYYTLGCN
jgi:tetratricopeptide (TPR) repeat protein